MEDSSIHILPRRCPILLIACYHGRGIIGEIRVSACCHRTRRLPADAHSVKPSASIQGSLLLCFQNAGKIQIYIMSGCESFWCLCLLCRSPTPRDKAAPSQDHRSHWCGVFLSVLKGCINGTQGAHTHELVVPGLFEIQVRVQFIFLHLASGSGRTKKNVVQYVVSKLKLT